MHRVENDVEFSVLWLKAARTLVVIVKSHGAAKPLYVSERLDAVGV